MTSFMQTFCDAFADSLLAAVPSKSYLKNRLHHFKWICLQGFLQIPTNRNRSYSKSETYVIYVAMLHMSCAAVMWRYEDLPYCHLKIELFISL